jgi:hypothetical protein
LGAAIPGLAMLALWLAALALALRVAVRRIKEAA